jgi:hypothetical protein
MARRALELSSDETLATSIKQTLDDIVKNARRHK